MYNLNSKAIILKDIYFLPLIEADLDNLAGFQYPQEVDIPSELTVTEIT